MTKFLTKTTEEKEDLSPLTVSVHHSWDWNKEQLNCSAGSRVVAAHITVDQETKSHARNREEAITFKGKTHPH